jgi:hypothetical protein
VAADRSQREVDHRGQGALDGADGPAAVQPPREGLEGSFQRPVERLELGLQLRRARARHEIFAPKRNEQAGVGGVTQREVVQRQRGGDGRARGIGMAERVEELALRAPDSADPQRGQEIVERGEAVVDRSLGRRWRRRSR